MWTPTKVAVALTFFVVGAWTGAAYGAERYEATGSSSMKHKSLPNALVAAHFKCNRKGLWANLETMEVSSTVSDRSRNPTYRTRVVFECSPNYRKELPEKE